MSSGGCLARSMKRLDLAERNDKSRPPSEPLNPSWRHKEFYFAAESDRQLPVLVGMLSEIAHQVWRMPSPDVRQVIPTLRRSLWGRRVSPVGLFSFSRPPPPVLETCVKVLGGEMERSGGKEEPEEPGKVILATSDAHRSVREALDAIRNCRPQRRDPASLGFICVHPLWLLRALSTWEAPAPHNFDVIGVSMKLNPRKRKAEESSSPNTPPTPTLGALPLRSHWELGAEDSKQLKCLSTEYLRSHPERWPAFSPDPSGGEEEEGEDIDDLFSSPPSPTGFASNRPPSPKRGEKKEERETNTTVGRAGEEPESEEDQLNFLLDSQEEGTEEEGEEPKEGEDYL